jgi:DeoR family transcriptional regulator, fructose operon transcriptional repressor
MQSEVRHKRIEEHLAKVEFASLDELSELVDASVSTVRRDLDMLESKGSLKRTHGGARLTNPKSDEFTFSNRDTHQLDEKETIGRACAELILPNQTVIIDAGTTCFHVARHLEAKNPHIVTNSLPVANHFSASNKLEVVVSGGVIYPRLGVLVGPLAVASFAQVRADLAIMSCGGITPAGVSNSHGLLIEIQRAMMHAARRVVLCVDHTKFGRQSISHLCALNAINTVITDESLSPEMRSALSKAGVELIVASPEGSKVALSGRKKTARSEQPFTAPDPLPVPADATEEKDSFLD